MSFPFHHKDYTIEKVEILIIMYFTYLVSIESRQFGYYPIIKIRNEAY